MEFIFCFSYVANKVIYPSYLLEIQNNKSNSGLRYVSLLFNNNNNNHIYLLQLGCYPVAVVILHVYKI